jgi:hypothetical protein
VTRTAAPSAQVRWRWKNHIFGLSCWRTVRASAPAEPYSAIRFPDRGILTEKGVRRQIIDTKTPPASRPLQDLTRADIANHLERALAEADGAMGAHCVHELWMRGEMSINIERALERLWARAAASVPEWLPMRYIEWLPTVYEIAREFRASAKGRSNIYLALLDYQDRDGTYGVYVGMSKYSPAQRFDQHKAGIRAAGSVLKRGIEVLTGPTLHLQYIKRSEASRIEEQLALALAAAGLRVRGGH